MNELYKMIPVKQFWEEYREGKHQTPKTLVIHNGEIDFAYVIRDGVFDHHRQGGTFKHEITKVLVKCIT